MRRAPRLVVLSLLSACGLGSGPSDAARSNSRGNALYREGKFEESLSSYAEAEAADRSTGVPRYNSGNALYRLGRSEEATRAYQDAAENQSLDAALRSAARFNLGTALLAANHPDEAAEAFRQLLLESPGDDDARRNLEIALARRRPQDQKDKTKSPGDKGNEGDKSNPEPKAGDAPPNAEKKDQGGGNQGNTPPAGDRPPPPDGSGRPENGGDSAEERSKGERRAPDIDAEEARRLLEAVARQEKAGEREPLMRKAKKRAVSDRDW
jgi:Ca-activated chloride channel homolog